VVTREDCGAVAILRLAHGRANALDPEILGALGEALTAAATRAVVLTGEGAMFSAGVDLKRLAAGGPDYPGALLPALGDCFARLFYHPRPVVAAVNGHAIAGGCVLACAADRRVAARGAARIGVTELLVGVPFPAIALEIMRSALSPGHFAEMVYGGRTVSVEEAARRGLVDEVVEPSGLVDAAVAAAEARRDPPRDLRPHQGAGPAAHARLPRRARGADRSRGGAVLARARGAGGDPPLRGEDAGRRPFLDTLPPAPPLRVGYLMPGGA